MKAKIPSRIRELAKMPPGPVFRLHLECQSCGFEWIADTIHSPLTFPCPACGKRKGERKDYGPSFALVSIDSKYKH